MLCKDLTIVLHEGFCLAEPKIVFLDQLHVGILCSAKSETFSSEICLEIP